MRRPRSCFLLCAAGGLSESTLTASRGCVLAQAQGYTAAFQHAARRFVLEIVRLCKMVRQQRTLLRSIYFAKNFAMKLKPQRSHQPLVRIRIVFGEDEMIGPGKADLLEEIGRCGSISAAGRKMGMSYKRAWELVGTLNTMFQLPLVDSTRGGPGGGGAVLTSLGHEVLAHYRAVEEQAIAAGADRLEVLRGLLSDIPEEK